MPVWIALYRMLADAGELDQPPSNLVFAPERCELATDPVTLQLPSGTSRVALGGALIRSAPGDYALRIDDIRLLGSAR